jgi:hypothetical protein
MSCVPQRQQELAKLFCVCRRQHKHKDMLYMKSDFKSYTQIYIYLRECVCVRGTQDEEKKKQAIYRNQIKAKLEPSARHGRFSASNAWISARKSIHSLHQWRHSVFVKCDAGKQRQAATAAIKVLRAAPCSPNICVR